MDLRSQSQTGGRGRFKLRSPASQIQVLFLVQSQKLGHNSPFPRSKFSRETGPAEQTKVSPAGQLLLLGGTTGRVWKVLNSAVCPEMLHASTLVSVKPNGFLFPPVTSLWLFSQSHGSYEVQGIAELWSPPASMTAGRVSYAVSV